MHATHSAVLVLVPEAESVVGEHRAVLDLAAEQGVPAHVTILFPFVPPERVDDDVLAALADAVKSVAAFDVRFARLRWFNRSVLWLEPDPAEPFAALTTAVRQAFPGYPPYDGAYAEVVHHLTVGQGQPEGLLATAEHAVTPKLPVAARISVVTLMQGSEQPGSWHAIAQLPLRPLP